jgi:hypothetical protein
LAMKAVVLAAAANSPFPIMLAVPSIARATGSSFWLIVILLELLKVQTTTGTFQFILMRGPGHMTQALLHKKFSFRFLSFARHIWSAFSSEAKGTYDSAGSISSVDCTIGDGEP